MTGNLTPLEHLVQHAVLYLQSMGISILVLNATINVGKHSYRFVSGNAYDISVMSNAFLLCSWSGRSIRMPPSPPFNGFKSVH